MSSLGDALVTLANYSDDDALQQHVNFSLLSQFSSPPLSDAVDTGKVVVALNAALDGTQVGTDTAQTITQILNSPAHQGNLFTPEIMSSLGKTCINLVSFNYDVFVANSILQNIANFADIADKQRAIIIATAFGNTDAVNILN